MSNVCLMCFVTFDNENDLRNHQCKSEPEQLQCSVSPMPFVTSQSTKKKGKISNKSDGNKSKSKKSRSFRNSKHSHIKPSKRRFNFITRRKYRYLSVQKRFRNVNTPFKFFCNACTRGYNSESSWKKHLHLHHTTGGYQCKYCKKLFISVPILTFHKRNHFEEVQFSCDFCPKVFISKVRLQAHRRGHINQLNGKIYPCHICDKKFSLKDYLKKHLEIHMNGSYRGKQKSRTCTICGKVLSSDYSLKNHYATHTGERNFACEEPGCDKKFKCWSNLDNHRKLIHLGIRSHHCFYCNVSCVRAGDLRNHYKSLKHQNRVKEAQESTPLDPGNEFVNIPDQLPWVGVRNVKEKKHPCNDCNVAFRSAANLRRHFLTLSHKIKVGEVPPGGNDTENKPFRCEDCDLSFMFNFHFKTHLESRRHFKTVEELKAGEASGTSYETILAQRKHRCEICSMRFTDARHLERHYESKKHKNKLAALETGVKNMYSERRHSCNDCNMMFFTTNHLKRHLGTLRHKKKIEELIASGINIKEEPVDPEDIADLQDPVEPEEILPN